LEWARALRRVYVAHPWLAELPILAPPLGPHQVTWMEVALQILEPTGAREAEHRRPAGRLRAPGEPQGHGAGCQVPGARRRPRPRRTRLRPGAGPADRPGAVSERERLVTSGLFERTTSAPSDPVDDPDFLFGLERLIGGIEVLCRRRRGEAWPKPSCRHVRPKTRFLARPQTRSRKSPAGSMR